MTTDENEKVFLAHKKNYLRHKINILIATCGKLHFQERATWYASQTGCRFKFIRVKSRERLYGIKSLTLKIEVKSCGKMLNVLQVEIY